MKHRYSILAKVPIKGTFWIWVYLRYIQVCPGTYPLVFFFKKKNLGIAWVRRSAARGTWSFWNFFSPKSETTLDSPFHFTIRIASTTLHLQLSPTTAHLPHSIANDSTAASAALMMQWLLLSAHSSVASRNATVVHEQRCSSNACEHEMHQRLQFRARR